LEHKVASVLGDGVTATVECVSAIPLLTSGKYRYVISHVADDFVDRLSERKQTGDRGAKKLRA
jgi:hypothetical protein